MPPLLPGPLAQLSTGNRPHGLLSPDSLPNVPPGIFAQLARSGWPKNPLKQASFLDWFQQMHCRGGQTRGQPRTGLARKKGDQDGLLTAPRLGGTWGNVRAQAWESGASSLYPGSVLPHPGLIALNRSLQKSGLGSWSCPASTSGAMKGPGRGHRDWLGPPCLPLPFHLTPVSRSGQPSPAHKDGSALAIQHEESFALVLYLWQLSEQSTTPSSCRCANTKTARSRSLSESPQSSRCWVPSSS
jgi:hypothetical protein